MAIELLTRAKGYFEHSKKVAFEKALAEGLVLLGRSDSSYYQIARAFKLFASNETQKTVAEHMKKYLTPGEPGQIFLSNLAKDVHPNYLRKYVARFITNIIFHNNNDKVKLEDGREVPIPAALLISPTMRCNLKCVGCYAGNYTRKDDLTQEEVESFLGQARDLGVRYFIILGGEPLIWKPLFDIFDKFSDCAFQFYTSGHLLDEDKVQRLVKAGIRNVDVSGAGGTSWVAVETERASGGGRALGEAFREWGIPTAASVAIARAVRPRFKTIIATGGITTGLDIARALALGAHAAGMARPVLQAFVAGGREGTIRFLEGVEAELRAAMLLVGARDVASLRKAPAVLGPQLRRWMKLAKALRKG